MAATGSNGNGATAATVAADANAAGASPRTGLRIYAELPLDAAEREALRELTRHDNLWLAEPANAAESTSAASLHARDLEAFRTAEVAFGAVSRELLQHGDALRWIQFPSVGVDYYRDIDWAALDGRVVCTNLRGVFTEPVAQTTLAAILALYRGLDELVHLQARREWRKLEVRPRLRVLQRAHVLMLGNGSLAARLCELLAAFGCTFATFARTGGDVRSAAELDAALAAADIVCGALPDTPATRGLLDARRLALLKPDALFVNIGRGSLVDEPALVAALRAGRLGGAVLDVTQCEPLPPDDPLWSCPNTLLTQHTSAGSSREILDTIALFGENLARYRASRPLLNVVDWSRGY